MFSSSQRTKKVKSSNETISHCVLCAIHDVDMNSITTPAVNIHGSKWQIRLAFHLQTAWTD